ncbi:MAG TPA: penicillin-binding protein 2 [Micropepsaceae bacterium]|jgi:penicillin-binding protein 2|nr:penicillin-binding protein 2 [Micropepsaceae bacterium]
MALVEKHKSRYAGFSRRTLLLSGGMTAVFGVLAARLYQLQIVNGDRYLTEAEENRINLRLLAPQRGRIFDRFGVPLANSRRNYRVLLIPEQTRRGVGAALDALAEVIPIDDKTRARVLKDAGGNRPFMPIVVAENLAWDDFARLNLNLPYLPGVQPDVGETRGYPYKEELSHVLGYVAAVSPEEKAKNNSVDPLLDLPGFRVGKRGVEKSFDAEIRGQAGASRVEVNAYGRVIRELDRESGHSGEDVYLTIDQELQSFLYERLQGESAGAAVMDVETGDLLALVSTPGFDPNAFNVGVTQAEWKALTEDDHKPLINKTLAGFYPPGSTFKTVTALAALDAGAITPDTVFTCSGQFTLGAHSFHCWKKGGHGTINLRQGLKVSCDCFFYQVALKLGIDPLQAAARRLGLGAPTGIEIPGERAGFIPDRAWKQKTFKEPWQLGETLVAGIGQGYILATPLQLCVLAARIAGGRKVTPRLVHSLGAQKRPVAPVEALDFSTEALDAVREAMNAVANEPGGTAYAWRITDPAFAMAGKTGTAQVRVISAEERASGIRSNESLPWKLRDHGIYIGFAPADKPRYACAVLIEHGGINAHPQVQLARDALLLAQKRDILGRPPAYPVNSADASL